MEADVALIIGGSFSPDHLGPERYEEIVAKVEKAPAPHLEALDRILARSDSAALARVYPSALLELTETAVTARTRSSAVGALALYDRALTAHDAAGDSEAFLRGLASDEERSLYESLLQRRASLQAMLARLPG